MKKILVVALLLVGCGGESFVGASSLDPIAADAADGAPTHATGGQAGADYSDSGVATGGTSSGGAASGGAPVSTGGANTGGVPVSTGGVSSSGGASGSGGSSGSTGGVTGILCCKYQTGVPGLVSRCGLDSVWVCDSSGGTLDCTQCVVGTVCHHPAVPEYWGVVEACP